MNRIILMLVRILLKLPYYFIGICYYGGKKRIGSEKGYAFIRKATINANKAGRVKIETHGVENIPEENGFIIFPNHQGLYDVLAILESCPMPFAFVMKKEVSNVVLLKQVSRALGSLAMDRENLKQSMQVINEMAERVKQGKNFLIFPEGTRSKERNKPGDFKAGSFKSAQKAKAPIIPCALIDAYKPFDEKSIQPVTVKVIYLPPMYYEEYKDMKTVEIAAEVKRRIENTIEKYIK